MDHKFFPGNRPSLSLLFPGTCNATSAGALLAAYEHRTMVQAAIWGTNCFDQWGVELVSCHVVGILLSRFFSGQGLGQISESSLRQPLRWR